MTIDQLTMSDMQSYSKDLKAKKGAVVEASKAGEVVLVKLPCAYFFYNLVIARACKRFLHLWKVSKKEKVTLQE